MSKTYLLNRKCSQCGKLIFDQSKTGMCGECYKHFPKTGKMNPFYGKHHSAETINSIKEKTKTASENLWKNENYRNKVLNAVIGLKRSEKFKHEQSERVKKQFNDPYQRKIRSDKMKESWQNGNIVFTPNPSTNRSKQELLFFTKLKEIINNALDKQVIKYVKNNKNRWLFPDVLIPDKKIIIEFNGSFWHADPRRFNSTDIVHRNITAAEIWKTDKYKKDLYQQLGYKYLCVWSDDFKKQPDETINNLIKQIEKC